MENLRQRIFSRNRKTAFFWEGGKQGHLLVNLKISLVLLPTLIPWNYLSFVQRNLYHLWKPLRRNSVWECKNRHESGLAAILRVSPCWEPQASLASFCNGNRYLKLCNVNVTTEIMTESTSHSVWNFLGLNSVWQLLLSNQSVWDVLFSFSKVYFVREGSQSMHPWGKLRGMAMACWIQLSPSVSSQELTSICRKFAR